MNQTPAAILELWTIYENPADYPGRFVVRRWVVRPDGRCVPDQSCTDHDSIDAAREKVPSGLHCLGKLPDDDRAIAETWV